VYLLECWIPVCVSALEGRNEEGIGR